MNRRSSVKSKVLRLTTFNVEKKVARRTHGATAKGTSAASMADINEFEDHLDELDIAVSP